MIEKIVLDYLSQSLSVPVRTEKVGNLPEEYVLIEKTGSSVENHINSATIAIQSYSTSMYGAASLNEEVKKAMDHLADSTNVYKSSLNSDYNFTDTQSKRYRYQAVYDVYY